MNTHANLHPIFHQLVGRQEKERRINQRARVIWFYGLSGSGKSTLAAGLERSLFDQGFQAHVLDGDNVRIGLNHDLGFSPADRSENIRRVAEVAKLFLSNGTIVICSFITPYREQREKARALVGAEDFLPVYVKASFEVCKQRDPKGLYAKAANGGVPLFTGQDSTFEPPLPKDADLVINTEAASAEESLGILLEYFLPKIRFS